MTDTRAIEQDGGGGDGGFLNHLPAILWQRRWLIIVPFMLIAIAAVAAALLLPAVYRSSAVLLVESQGLPKDVVPSPAAGAVDERIARIHRKVLSRGDLMNLIQQHGLYEAERRSTPLSALAGRMREATKIEPLDSDVGKSQEAGPIAFTMSFDYPEPAKAQLVMQNYVDSFLELDSAEQSDKANNMVTFLTRQTQDLQRQVAEIEGQITSIKSRNGAVLASAGMSTAATPGSYDAQIAALQRDKLSAVRQVQPRTKDPALAAAEGQLASARAVYAETHPDVVIARQRLDEIRRMVAANPRESAAPSVASQVAATNAEIAALGRARAAESTRLNSAAAAQARAPVVMEQITQLENRAAILRTQYQDASTRLLSASSSAQMELENKGERLTLVDPPALPDRPLSPNRPLLIVGGIMAGLFLGVALALLAELILRPVRGVGQIERLLGVGPLSVVPTLKAGAPRRRQEKEGGSPADYSQRAGASQHV